MDFNKVKLMEKENIMPTYGRFSVALVSGKGATAVDIEGKKYIDFGSGIGVNSLGYCDDGWVKAVSEQTAKLQHISNLYYSPIQVEFAEKLCKATGFSKAFLCNSGAEANECAIKLARKYSFDKYGSGRDKIITLVNSFHGRTVTTLSATGQDAMHNYFYPFTEGFEYIKANDISALENAAKDGICAVMLECIQGEGGVLPIDKDYLKAVRELCNKNDIMLIIDEVQTGIGRTGKILAQEHFNIKADITTVAKGIGAGLPLGACLCNDNLANVMSAGTHGSTFGGNPVACAGGKYVLDKINNPEFLNEINEKSEWLFMQLKSIPQIKEVRGMGLMIGADIDADAKDIASKCVENGLLILTAKTSLRFLPPLNITYDELKRGLDILKSVLKK